MGGLMTTAIIGEVSLDPPSYDVSAALRSDESPEGLEPEGAGPGRRRYVREDARYPVLPTTLTLVRENPALTEISERRRRLNRLL